MVIGDLLSEVTGMRLPEAARLFAQAGVPVFPCLPGGKRPLTGHGFHDATIDTRQVAAWWRRWPGANIGIPTGPLSSVDVVDVDVHPAGSGYAALRRARAAGLLSGWAALARTPSGGLHVYFPSDPARPQPSWQAAGVQVDFRGAGGYVIASPSAGLRPDGPRVAYALVVASGTTPAPVDAARLRHFLDPRPVVPAFTAGRPREIDASRLAGWVAARGEGERNRGLFWAACRLAEAGTTPADAVAALGPAAEHAGLGLPEIAATIRSAYRATHTAPTAPGAGQSESPPRVVRVTPDRLLS
ncbi:bifunctional DNA primase/polymerase [Rathayibacter soli]|uniref:bifunctional DNA primase/polymerase n=1 Tax=Rathayibacter soli TaxID=3144168 RepID=UPI0027E54532|nr:bifunctional DNA primase/polymerase [Glaciibacter superstes]